MEAVIPNGAAVPPREILRGNIRSRKLPVSNLDANCEQLISKGFTRENITYIGTPKEADSLPNSGEELFQTAI